MPRHDDWENTGYNFEKGRKRFRDEEADYQANLERWKEITEKDGFWGCMLYGLLIAGGLFGLLFGLLALLDYLI